MLVGILALLGLGFIAAFAITYYIMRKKDLVSPCVRAVSLCFTSMVLVALSALCALVFVIGWNDPYIAGFKRYGYVFVFVICFQAYLTLYSVYAASKKQ